MRIWRKTLSVAFWLAVLLIGAFAVQEQIKKAGSYRDQKECYAYVLTMDKISKFADVRRALESLKDYEQTLDKMEDDKSLSVGTFAERARSLEINYPEVATTIQKEGISTREYLLGNHVLVRVLILSAAKKEGAINEYAKDKQDVNPANLMFVEQHAEEIRRSMQDIRIRM